MKTPEEYRAEAQAKFSEIENQFERDGGIFRLPGMTEEESKQFLDHLNSLPLDDQIDAMMAHLKSITDQMEPAQRSELLKDLANFLFWIQEEN
jgi:hypothetical protein